VFATSDGDKTSVRADRGADGALRVVMRGDVYDGRNFVKAAMGGPTDPRIKANIPISISTSSFAWWRVISARRSAASIGACRAVAAGSHVFP